MKKIFTSSPEETMELGMKVAKMLKKGDVIVLSRRLRFWKNKVYRRNFKIFWKRRRDF